MSNAPPAPQDPVAQEALTEGTRLLSQGGGKAAENALAMFEQVSVGKYEQPLLPDCLNTRVPVLDMGLDMGKPVGPKSSSQGGRSQV